MGYWGDLMFIIIGFWIVVFLAIGAGLASLIWWMVT